MIDIKNVVEGQSYACKFRSTTLLDLEGQPHPQGSIGDYEGVGVILRRDLDAALVRLADQKTGQEFVVGFDNIWDVDTIEWIDKTTS